MVATLLTHDGHIAEHTAIAMAKVEAPQTLILMMLLKLLLEEVTADAAPATDVVK